MAGTGSLNLPGPLEQVKSAYRAHAGALPPADRQALARRAGHVFSMFVRLSLEEPQAMRSVQEAERGLLGCSGLDMLLPGVLDGALRLTGADFGSVRLAEPPSRALKMVTWSGFGSGFAPRLAVIDQDRFPYGEALREFAQIAIADVRTDPWFAPYREIAAAAGFRAVVFTPLADTDGRLLGVVSAHFRQAGHRPARDLQVTELYGNLSGEMISRHLGLAPGGLTPGGLTPGGPPAHGEGDLRFRPASQDHRTGMTFADDAGEVVRTLATAGLMLACAQASISDGLPGDQIAAAIDELDHAICGIRAMVSGRTGRDRPCGD